MVNGTASRRPHPSRHRKLPPQMFSNVSDSWVVSPGQKKGGRPAEVAPSSWVLTQCPASDSALHTCSHRVNPDNQIGGRYPHFLKLREAKQPVQDHTADRKQNNCWAPGCLPPKPVLHELRAIVFPELLNGRAKSTQCGPALRAAQKTEPGRTLFPGREYSTEGKEGREIMSEREARPDPAGPQTRLRYVGLGHAVLQVTDEPQSFAG